MTGMETHSRASGLRPRDSAETNQHNLSACAAKKQPGAPRSSSCGIRSQSALEYLITYSWAILLIAIFVTFLYLYVALPKSVTPSTCSFALGFYCDDIILGTNLTTHTTALALMLTNTQPDPVENPAIFVNFNGTNSSQAPCYPKYILAGGDIICEIKVPISTKLGGFLGGSLFLNATYCGFAENATSPSSCSSAAPQIFAGQFSSHAQSELRPSVTIGLNGSNDGKPVLVNTSVTMYATVDLLGYPLRGATVNFTENSTLPVLSPGFSDANPSGVAESFISSNAPLTVNVTAHFAGYNASYTIQFIEPAVTTSTTTIGSGSTTMAVPSCYVQYCNVVPLCTANPKCPVTTTGVKQQCTWYECVS